jgi:hypothetical protein
MNVEFREMSGLTPREFVALAHPDADTFLPMSF